MQVADRVQELVARVESLDDPDARETALELLGAVLELYGEGLERVLAILDSAGEAGASVKEAMAGDGVVSSLLLIHGLHPTPLETRVREALERVRPYMESHGGGVELLGLEGEVAHLRLHGSCDGCPSSASTLSRRSSRSSSNRRPTCSGSRSTASSTGRRPPSAGRRCRWPARRAPRLPGRCSMSVTSRAA